MYKKSNFNKKNEINRIESKIRNSTEIEIEIEIKKRVYFVPGRKLSHRLVPE